MLMLYCLLANGNGYVACVSDLHLLLRFADMGSNACGQSYGPAIFAKTAIQFLSRAMQAT